MVDLELVLSWLSMSQYLERFVQAGFDSWGTVMEITEEDLEALNVDLGHRRKLQREIANSRKLANRQDHDLDPFSVRNDRESVVDGKRLNSPNDPPAPAQRKRGYVHHPKPDPNAPERPYSAYVLFSKMVREELKSQPLSFTKMSKQVGERWQRLTPEDKHIWTQRAAIPREDYKIKFAKYQQSENHRRYLQYLADFRSAHGTRRGDSSPHRNEAASPSANRPNISAAQPQTQSPQAFRDLEMKDLEADGDRVQRIGDEDASPSRSRRPRTAHACEPCRQRKIKCRGEWPNCGQCRHLNLTCSYGQSKEDGKKRFSDSQGNRTDKGLGAHGMGDHIRRKLKAYESILCKLIPQVGDEDRAAIRQCLLMPPQLNKGLFNQRLPRPKAGADGHAVGHADRHVDGEADGHTDGSVGGESDISGIGSMGSTGHAHEEEFKGAQLGRNLQAFVGQSSEEKWIQRLEKELPDSPSDEWRFLRSIHSSSADDGSPSPKSSCHAEDIDTSIGNEIDPYGLPIKDTADRLVAAFFTTIYPSFPIINEAYFSNRYEECFGAAQTDKSKDQTFLLILQIVLAIGAVHAHMVRVDWAGDERDHLLYFARARALGAQTGLLTESVYHEQVQIFGLGAIYLLVTNQINRAWSTIGLAIRYAQALGMHLLNATPTLSDAEKDFRVGIWYSIVSLERVVTVMTGRPSMVKDEDCSVTIPSIGSEKAYPSQAGQDGEPKSMSAEDTNVPPSSNYSIQIFKRAEKPPHLSPDIPHPVAYFSYYAQLNAISQLVVDELYNPTIRDSKWSDIQRKIQRLDEKLLRWAAILPAVFDIQAPSSSLANEAYRVALGILFCSTRMIINRPCLCRLDSKMANQAESSREANQRSAERCVVAAKAVLDFISDEDNLDRILSGPLWWMLSHHLKRATTILLLGLAFRSADQASEAEKDLVYAKKAVSWLKKMAMFSEAAKSSWITLSQLLRLTAEKIGADTSDIIPAPPHSTDQSMHAFSGLGSILTPDTPSIWPQQQDSYSYGFYHPGTVFDDLTTLELDDFGFLQNPGVLNLYPTSTENAKNAAIGQESDDSIL